MGQPYRKIILVSDGTATSHAAAQTALNLARQHSAKVLVVDSVRPPTIASTWLTGNAREVFDMVVADKQDRLTKVAAILHEAGVDAQIEILFGKSSEEIARTAISEKADLVIR